MELSFERIEVLLLIAAVVAMVARKLRLPYTVGLTIAGIAIAVSPLQLKIELTKEMIFTAFLPPLIFEAAIHLKWKELRKDGGVIMLLATAGVVMACGVTAGGLYYFAGWPWAAAVPLGLLISATDPVSVIATFKEAGVTGRLRLLVEAESLLNDGTVAVLYGVALAVFAGGEVTAKGIAGDFFMIVLGGIVCGGAVGGLILLLAGRTNDHLIELTFSTVAAYGSFFVAEHFHVSGVLATLTAGVLIGNTGHMGAFSDRGRTALVSFWNYAGFVVNSLIFLLIGMSLVVQEVSSVLAIASFVVLLVLLGRAVAVYASCALFAGSTLRVSLSHQHILVWGGLRGALALALALGLPKTTPLHDTVVSVAFAVVAFSVIVQGLTMPSFLRRMGALPVPAMEGKS